MLLLIFSYSTLSSLSKYCLISTPLHFLLPRLTLTCIQCTDLSVPQHQIRESNLCHSDLFNLVGERVDGLEISSTRPLCCQTECSHQEQSGRHCGRWLFQVASGGSCSVNGFGAMVSGVQLLLELGPSIFLSRKNPGRTKVAWACVQHFHVLPHTPQSSSCFCFLLRFFSLSLLFSIAYLVKSFLVFCFHRYISLTCSHQSSPYEILALYAQQRSACSPLTLKTSTYLSASVNVSCLNHANVQFQSSSRGLTEDKKQQSLSYLFLHFPLLKYFCLRNHSNTNLHLCLKLILQLLYRIRTSAIEILVLTFTALQ